MEAGVGGDVVGEVAVGVEVDGEEGFVEEVRAGDEGEVKGGRGGAEVGEGEEEEEVG